jgi:hypothetical protein
MTASNIVELNFAETRTAIELLFASDTATIVKSAPGQGKTSMIQQMAEEQGSDFGLFEINCALANQPDFMGWFYRCTEEHVDYDGNEVSIEAGRYTYPYFLFDKRTGRPAFQYKRGVIVFEEYGQADLDLKRALGQTFLEKRVGQHVIPQNFNIIALSNRDTDRSAVTKDYDFLINRRAEVHFRNTIDDYLVMAHAKGMLNMTMAFASIAHHGVFTGEVPKEQGPWLTPRSLDAVDRLMKTVMQRKIDIGDPVVRTTVAGEIGAGSAHQYIAFAALRDKIPSVSEIIKDPDGTEVPKATDQQMFLVFNMADKADKGNIAKLVRYMARLPTDMAVAFYRNALHRDKSLMACKEFGDWAVKNKSLLAVVNSRIQPGVA